MTSAMDNNNAEKGGCGWLGGGSIKLEKCINYVCSDPQDSPFKNGLQPRPVWLSG